MADSKASKYFWITILIYWQLEYTCTLHTWIWNKKLTSFCCHTELRRPDECTLHVSCLLLPKENEIKGEINKCSDLLCPAWIQVVKRCYASSILIRIIYMSLISSALTRIACNHCLFTTRKNRIKSLVWT